MSKQAKFILSFLFIALLSLSACGAASGSKASSYYMEDGDYLYETTAAATSSSYEYAYEKSSSSVSSDSGLSSSAFVVPSDEKLVYTSSVSLETLTFDDTLRSIREMILLYNGFVQSEKQTDASDGWYYSDYSKTSGTLYETLVVRVPSENYSDFLNGLSDLGKITSRTQEVENITTAYYDTATTISSLKAQEERLLEMMEDSKSIEDMLAIEDRLSEVQNELAIYQNRLQTYDLDVAYSTVSLSIREVLEYTPDDEPQKTSTFGDRLKNTLKSSWSGFTSFLEGFLFLLIRVTPILSVLGLIAFVITFSIIRSVRKKRARAEAKKQQSAE